MIKDIKSRKINTIIVIDMSHIAEKNDVIYKILELHDKYNIDFISVNDKLDTINNIYTFELLSFCFTHLEKENMIKREWLRRKKVDIK